MDKEMKKLERISKQIANIDEIEIQLAKSIRTLANIVLADAKYTLISNRTKVDGLRKS